jgi:hypothetical protein
MVRFSITVAAAMLLSCQAALAQGADVTDRVGVSGGEIWAGYSPGSTSAGVLGRHNGIKLGLVGLRWNHRIRASEHRFVDYTLDVIPVARVEPIIAYSAYAAEVCAPPKFDCQRVPVTAHGLGLNPLGVTVVYRADRTVQWRLGATGGVLLFDRRAPSDLAARFNYTAAIEGGMQVVNRRGSGMLLVYRLHHLSNAGQAEDNLAILSHVFSLGVRWRLGG